MYEERIYRGFSRPSDLVCYEVRVKETDLFCCTQGDHRGYIEERVIAYRHQLEEYIRFRPAFLESLDPIDSDPLAPRIVQAMIEASRTLGVGPMACVAGAVAEFVGRDVAPRTEEYIIENGGDIFLRTGKERTVLVYAKDSPYSGRLAIKLKPDDAAYGVCTSSGTVGPSLSFGKADAVCVLARSALFADGLATRIGNVVKRPEDVQAAIDVGRGYQGVIGILIVLGETLGAWGDLELMNV
jgi:ApbE superfamily uncharacterized protein (UPF0280 family)